jgi:cAMP-binding proteins - catabolite gene activator and regulatory subunit of cAMP-dependent protein kinases
MEDARTEDSSLTVITGSHLFRSLDEAGRERLMQGAARAHFDARQIVVREGDPGEALYLIRSGEVEVFTMREGQRVLLSVLQPGACFGEVALLSKRPRTATVLTRTPCTLLCFYRSQIEEILVAYPRVRELLESVVLGRARQTIERITRPPTGRGERKKDAE